MTGTAVSAWRLDRGASGWPDRLEHLGVPPSALWLRGALPSQEAPGVAIVGSRQASFGALRSARELARELAGCGITVISGMARGIDAEAHLGALEGGGPTIAVLGCGIDICYPREHLRLRDRIAALGCVISEDGGGEPPERWRFPRRNRLIAAFAEAVVVVEATASSGALSTARWAADLGREVLAMPGSIRNPTSAGTNLLIRDGVRPFLVTADLFESVPALRRAFSAHLSLDITGGSEAEIERAGAGLEEDPTLRSVLDRLGSDPIHPDDLAAALGVAAGPLAAALTTLQVRGAIAEVCGGRVVRTF